MNKSAIMKKVFRWESSLVALLALEVLIFGGLNPKFLEPRVQLTYMVFRA